MKRSAIPAAAILLGTALLLGGCSGHTGIKAFDRAATPDDTLPAQVSLPDDVDAGSVRLLAVGDGTKYFGATNADKSMGCVVVYRPGNADDWVAGCGGMGGAPEIVEASGANPKSAVILVRDDADTRERESNGWTRLADNILVPAS